MNTKTVIAKRELAAYFAGATAYIVIGLFLLFSGFLFFAVFFFANRPCFCRFLFPPLL